MSLDGQVVEPVMQQYDVSVLCRPDQAGIDTAWVKRFVVRVLELAGSESGQMAVVLADDEEVRELNSRYRGKDRVTDILSFPGDEPLHPDLIGEVIIAVGKAARQAAQRHHSLAVELRYLLIHGVLHLLGHDHETDQGEMNEEERRIRAALSEELHGGGTDRRSPGEVDG